MIEDARALLTALCESQVADPELEALCARLLHESPIHHERTVQEYLVPFEEAVAFD